MYSTVSLAFAFNAIPLNKTSTVCSLHWESFLFQKKNHKECAITQITTELFASAGCHREKLITMVLKNKWAVETGVEVKIGSIEYINIGGFPPANTNCLLLSQFLRWKEGKKVIF